MTPEKQRIAIAGACGWTSRKSNLGDYPVWRNPKSGLEQGQLPSYLSDLNAAHEAEKGLMLKNQYEQYVYEIVKLLQAGVLDPSCNHQREEWVCSAVHATAAQRAEAFLRTLNLWEKETAGK